MYEKYKTKQTYDGTSANTTAVLNKLHNRYPVVQTKLWLYNNFFSIHYYHHSTVYKNFPLFINFFNK